MLVVFLALWAVLAGTIAIGAVHWATRRKHEQRLQAYREILREKGIEQAPNESIKAALIRARRSEHSTPPRPLPPFARPILQRPASRPSWTNEGPSPTQHIGGHTFESEPPTASHHRRHK